MYAPRVVALLHDDKGEEGVVLRVDARAGRLDGRHLLLLFLFIVVVCWGVGWGVSRLCEWHYMHTRVTPAHTYIPTYMIH